MIQPLKSSKTTWFVYWLDLEEPAPAGSDYFLPTLLIVCDPAGAPLAAPDILEELDQVRVENLLIKLFDRLGAPDRLTICASDDWDNDAWKTFSQDHRVEIRFQRFDRSGPDELRALARTVVLRFAREEDSAPRSKEVARGLVNTALRIRSPRKKIALLRTALARDADCSSARIELADVEVEYGNWKVCLAAYDEVIARETPRWQERHPEWWTNRETRLLLRALYGRAMTLWHQGRHGDSAVQFEELLSLNTRDNQGVRFFIPLLHLLDEDTEAAARISSAMRKNTPTTIPNPPFFWLGLVPTLEGDEAAAREDTARRSSGIFTSLRCCSRKPSRRAVCGSRTTAPSQTMRQSLSTPMPCSGTANPALRGFFGNPGRNSSLALRKSSRSANAWPISRTSTMSRSTRDFGSCS